MLIESWIAVMIMVVVFAFGFIGIVGWILEGERHEAQVRENKALREENKVLAKILAHRNALDNIKVATEYYESKEN